MTTPPSKNYIIDDEDNLPSSPPDEAAAATSYEAALTSYRTYLTEIKSEFPLSSSSEDNDNGRPTNLEPDKERNLHTLDLPEENDPMLSSSGYSGGGRFGNLRGRMQRLKDVRFIRRRGRPFEYNNNEEEGDEEELRDMYRKLGVSDE